MKKILFTIILLLSFAFNVKSDINCYYLNYIVKVKNVENPYTREVYISDNFVKIINDTDKFIVFDLKKKIAYSVNLILKTVKQYRFEENNPFYMQFIVSFGVLSNNDSLIFPDVIFRATGKSELINGKECYQVKLPGSFLNSTTYYWFKKEKSEFESKFYLKYISCFTKNENVLKQVKEIGGFPVKIDIKLEVNLQNYGKTMELVESFEKKVNDSFFEIPLNLNLIKNQGDK